MSSRLVRAAGLGRRLKATPPRAADQVAERIRAALDWIGRSQDATSGGGSSAYYGKIAGWALPYPETTGYIIPTLRRAATRLGIPEFTDRATRMVQWLMSIQSSEGWFPGGLWKSGRPGRASVFNTAQILTGLVECLKHSQDAGIRESAMRAASWLIHEQSPDGRWYRGAYLEGYSPSYYSYVCWPLAEYWKISGYEPAREVAIRGLNAVLSDRTSVGSFTNWGFKPNKPGYTHTIGYTIQGLMECARIFDMWKPFGEAAQDSSERLMKKFEQQKYLAGAYDADWRPKASYLCLTGHCQLAICWLHLFARSADPRFLNVAVRALDEVSERQSLQSSSPGVRGAIPGSSPLWGRYMMLRYPNWGAKFFVDAMFAYSDNLDRLRSS